MGVRAEARDNRARGGRIRCDEDAIEWHVEWAFRYAFQENVFFFVLPESCDLLS